MYKRRGRVGDKLTTLFLYYWKMGNLFLGHFLLTGKEIPKKLQFLKFGESWISIICNACRELSKFFSPFVTEWGVNENYRKLKRKRYKFDKRKAGDQVWMDLPHYLNNSINKKKMNIQIWKIRIRTDFFSLELWVSLKLFLFVTVVPAA